MSQNITGNKGEWSEKYVLLRLLSQGKIYAANEHLEKLEKIYFPILKIFREEPKKIKYEYVVKEDIAKIQIYVNSELVNELYKAEFSSQADYLYSRILRGENRSFSVEETEEFMHKIGCGRLAAPSSDKTDITMQVHDIQTGFAPICGFSIKSKVGKPSTLIYASGATNFIYHVKGLSDAQINSINAIDTKTKIKDRMSRLFMEAHTVEFINVSSDAFARHMMLIDSRMTELIAHSLIYHYRDRLSTCKEVVAKMEIDNPMNYPNDGFYEYKYKKLLCSAALGMTPTKKWVGIDDANGGYIIVTAKGDVLAFHIYNRAFFEAYLLNQTKYDRGSIHRHGFASLYKEDDKVLLKLNLQIRFK